MSKDQLIHRGVAVTGALQIALVTFHVLDAAEAGALAGIALAFLVGYRTDRADA
jgi:hypothetical protein